MRERLIELISQADEECKHSRDCKSCSGYGKGALCMNYHIADHLLANGVVVPPCKVGDKVYYIYRFKGKKVGEARVVEICRGECGLAYHLNSEYATYFDLQEKEVFLTREEAERALKGGGQE